MLVMRPISRKKVSLSGDYLAYRICTKQIYGCRILLAAKHLNFELNFCMQTSFAACSLRWSEKIKVKNMNRQGGIVLLFHTFSSICLKFCNFKMYSSSTQNMVEVWEKCKFFQKFALTFFDWLIIIAFYFVVLTAQEYTRSILVQS